MVRELENGTPVDCTSYASGKTALHLAAAAGHAAVVKVLLERGASVETKDAVGETPLHLAVSEGRAACVVELLRNGADAWAHKNAQGKSAYAQAQELAKSNNPDGQAVLQAFSDVYDMGGSDKQKADNSQPPRWVPDDSVTECFACKDAFTVVRRKHHCRCASIGGFSRGGLSLLGAGTAATCSVHAVLRGRCLWSSLTCSKTSACAMRALPLSWLRAAAAFPLAHRAGCAM